MGVDAVSQRSILSADGGSASLGESFRLSNRTDFSSTSSSLSRAVTHPLGRYMMTPFSVTDRRGKEQDDRSAGILQALEQGSEWLAPVEVQGDWLRGDRHENVDV